MKPSLLELLRCPACGAASLAVAGAGPAGAEDVRAGEAACGACGARYAIRDGILDLHVNPTEEAKSEMAAHRTVSATWLRDLVPAHLHGLFEGESAARIALEQPHCRHPELVEAVPQLRRLEELADDYLELLRWLDLGGNETVVEVGAHTGWSARHLAERAGRVVATDISHDLRGAQVYLDHGIYFDRVFCDMTVFPFRDGVLDLVFGVATIHHAADIESLFAAFFRALKTGGRAVFFAEPVAGRWDRAAVETFGAEERELGAQEHIYTIGQYFAAARRAGFTPRVVPQTGLCRETARAWPGTRRAALRLLESGYGYSAAFTRGLYPLLLNFYPRIPFPRFALILDKR